MGKSKENTLLVLMAIFAVNSLDRHILSITLDQIGTEFTLSDTQLGLLSGFVFSIVYVVFGFPVAKLAARGNRRNIISASIAIWSLMTIAMSGAQSFGQLALARMGVGIGEAGAVSPAHSMISDLYPPEKRTSAIAVVTAGANIGVLLAFLIGGVIGQLYGWRWAFFIAGIPGVFLAVLLRFTVEEPIREKSNQIGDKSKSLFISTLKVIWQDKGLFHALCGFTILGIVTYGALAWNPSFIIRAFEFTQAQAGIFLALTVGVGGGFGTWFSGKLADRWGLKNPKMRIGIVVIVILLSKPFVIAFLLVENINIALASLVVAASMAAVFWAPTFAFVHSRVSSEMRPMATAIFLFALNLIGVGVGPSVVGMLSDTVFSHHGTRSISYALLSVQIAGIWAAWHFWQVMRQINTEKS